MPHAARTAVAFALALALLLTAACGSGSGGGPSDPNELPEPTPPGSGGGSTTTPPPAPPAPPIFDADAYVHQRVVPLGGFPSDVLRHGETIFTTDGDQIGEGGAFVVPVDVSLPVPGDSAIYRQVAILPTHLSDHLGAPVDIRAPIGFGFYLNDLDVVDDHLGLVLVNAGGSDLSPSLSNLIAFDPTTGIVIQTVNLANPYSPAPGATDSAGAPVPPGGFLQSGAEAMAWTFSAADAETGRLYVAMTNLVFGPPSNGTVKYPGTVQVFDLVPGTADPIRLRPQGAQVTQTLDLGGFNPGALAMLQVAVESGEPPKPARLLVTVAGATAFDASFQLVPQTPAFVAAYDTATNTRLVRFDLGLVGLAATRPALGPDASGNFVGFFPSAVTGRIYLLRLDGLRDATVDLTRLAVLRGPNNGIPIAPDQSGGPGGNVTGLGLSSDGRTLVVAGFGDLYALPSPLPGRLYLLGLPDDVITGSEFGVNFIPGWTLYGTVPGRTLGTLALSPNDGSRPDVFVAVSSPFDASTFLATGPASLGSLQTFGLFP